MIKFQSIFNIFWKYRKGLLLLLLVFTYFFRLGSHVIFPWDESRNVVNSQEMYDNNNFIVTHFDGQPDMWNTKPPLLSWLQVISMHILGENEFAVRFPSALAAVGICLVLISFFKRSLKNELGGYIAALVVVSTKAFVVIHGARRGDFDTVMVFFQVLGVLKLYEYFLTRTSSKLYFGFLFIALAVLTKSTAGFFVLPGFIFYSIINKKFHFVYKNKHLYFAALLCLFIVCCFYLTRDYYNPGYIKMAWFNDIGGRYLLSQVADKKYLLFYLHMFTARYLFWTFFIPLGVYLGYIKGGVVKEITGLLLSIVVVLFLILSTAATKLYWYELPMYPFLAILVAIFFTSLMDFESKRNRLMLFAAFFSINYAITAKQVLITKPTFDLPEGTFNIAEYFKVKIEQGITNKNYKILNRDSASVAVSRFYINKLKKLGNKVSYVKEEELVKGDTVLTSKRMEAEYVIKNFEEELVETHNTLQLYVIH